jgi:hypothetical protein
MERVESRLDGATLVVRIPMLSAARRHHGLGHGDIVGRDDVGGTIIQLAVDDRVLETLMTFDAEAAQLEPDADDEEDGSPIVVELVRPKMVERRRARASGCD